MFHFYPGQNHKLDSIKIVVGHDLLREIAMSMRVVVMKRPRPAALKRPAGALANVRSVVLKSAKAGSVALKRPALSFATAKSVASKSDETESRKNTAKIHVQGAGDRRHKPNADEVDSDEDCPLSGELQFSDCESRQGSYQQNAERAKAGDGLIVVARDIEGCKLGEVLYRISDTVDHETGLTVECSYPVNSAKVGARHTNIIPTSGHLLHLCKRSPCSFGKDDDAVIHVTERKAFAPTAVSEPWVGPKAVQRWIEEPKKAHGDKTTTRERKEEKGMMIQR